MVETDCFYLPVKLHMIGVSDERAIIPRCCILEQCTCYTCYVLLIQVFIDNQKTCDDLCVDIALCNADHKQTAMDSIGFRDEVSSGKLHRPTTPPPT